MLAREILEEEVTHLAGRRYARDKPLDGRYCRWGTNPGSISIGDERVPIQVPRFVKALGKLWRKSGVGRIVLVFHGGSFLVIKMIT